MSDNLQAVSEFAPKKQSHGQESVYKFREVSMKSVDSTSGILSARRRKEFKTIFYGNEYAVSIS